ncbi:hypothetical protein LTR10_014985 [Elasticomyces elasticus]|nr:hypothetical protein LTR10_014985 [Elasticomyces elasticus]KAK4964563.1 hypothetical protein LTR42_012859 [Elasticomyces elasticus]
MASLKPPNTLHRTPEHFLTYAAPSGGDKAHRTLKSKPALSAQAALMPLCVQQTPPSTHHPHHGGDSDITFIRTHSSTIYTITGLLASGNGSLDGLAAMANSADTQEEDFRRAQKHHIMAGEDSEEQDGHSTTTTLPTSTLCAKAGLATSPPPPWPQGMPSVMPRPAPTPSSTARPAIAESAILSKQQERHRAGMLRPSHQVHHHIDLMAGLESRASGRKSRLRG